MPSINYNMDETLVNIARPAVLEITDSLKRITGFDRDESGVNFFFANLNMAHLG